MSAAPSPYAELISVLDNLPTLVREKRRREGLTILDASFQTGIARSTLTQLERGNLNPSLRVVREILEWIGEAPRRG